MDYFKQLTGVTTQDSSCQPLLMVEREPLFNVEESLKRISYATKYSGGLDLETFIGDVARLVDIYDIPENLRGKFKQFYQYAIEYALCAIYKPVQVYDNKGQPRYQHPGHSIVDAFYEYWSTDIEGVLKCDKVGMVRLHDYCSVNFDILDEIKLSIIFLGHFDETYVMAATGNGDIYAIASLNDRRGPQYAFTDASKINEAIKAHIDAPVDNKLEVVPDDVVKIFQAAMTNNLDNTSKAVQEYQVKEVAYEKLYADADAVLNSLTSEEKALLEKTLERTDAETPMSDKEGYALNLFRVAKTMEELVSREKQAQNAEASDMSKRLVNRFVEAAGGKQEGPLNKLLVAFVQLADKCSEEDINKLLDIMEVIHSFVEGEQASLPRNIWFSKIMETFRWNNYRELHTKPGATDFEVPLSVDEYVCITINQWNERGVIVSVGTEKYYVPHVG